MSLFQRLNGQVHAYTEDDDDSELVDKLRELTAPHFIPDIPSDSDDQSQPADGVLGDKRKL